MTDENYRPGDGRRPAMPHHVILEGRSRLSVSGVEDVESFDETGVALLTAKGPLIIRGTGLRVDKLSIDGGEIHVEGRIDAMQYEDLPEQKPGLWSRLFG